MLPHGTEPVRVVDRFTVTPTAVAQPWRIQEATFTDAAVVGAPLPSGAYFCAVSRNPLAACITYLASPVDDIGIWDYAVAWDCPLLSFAISYGGYPTPFVLPDYAGTSGPVMVANRVGNVIGMAMASTISPYGASSVHDGYLFAAQHLSSDWVFLSAGMKVQVLRLAGPFYDLGTGVSNIEYTLERLDGEQPLVVDFAKEASGNPALTGLPGRMYSSLTTYCELGGVNGLTSDGYYRLRVDFYSSASAPGTNVAVGLEVRSVGKSFYSITPLPGVLSHSMIIRRIRVSGVASMLSPYSANMFRGGRCAGRQLETGIPWYLAAKTVDDIISMSGAVDRPFSRGIYGFMKPDSIECLQLQPLYSYPMVPTTSMIAGSPGSQQIPQWPIAGSMSRFFNSVHNPVFPAGGWLFLSVEAPLGELGSGAAYPMGRCHFSTFFNVEYATADTWVATTTPQSQPYEFDQALQMVRMAPQFHDNPMHAREILNFVGSAAKTAWRMAPSLAAALQFTPWAAAGRAIGTVHALADPAVRKVEAYIEGRLDEKAKEKKQKPKTSKAAPAVVVDVQAAPSKKKKWTKKKKPG